MVHRLILVDKLPLLLLLSTHVRLRGKYLTKDGSCKALTAGPVAHLRRVTDGCGKYWRKNG
jgi:hypothetical protein